MGSGSTADLSINKQQICKVFDRNMNFLNVWMDAPLLDGFKETMSGGITQLQVQLPRKFDDYDQAGAPFTPGVPPTIVAGNIVQYWLIGPNLPQQGLLRFQGFIDKYEPYIDLAGKESVTVYITPFSNVIGDHGLGTSIAFGTPGVGGTYVDPVTMFNWFFANADPVTGVSYMSPLTADPSNPVSSGVTAQYTFSKQDQGTIFQNILLMLPHNWFWRVNPNRTVTLNVCPTTPQHILYLGQHMMQPKYAPDWSVIKNDIVLDGKSPVAARATGSDITTFGQRVLFKSDSRITDSSTCAAVAQGLLNLYDQPLFRSPITLYDFRGDTQYGIGYDIETIKVGDTVEIVDLTGKGVSTLWNEFNWDDAQWNNSGGALFNTVIQIVELTYHFDHIDINLGAPAPNVTQSLLQVQKNFSDWTMGT